jgi:hypothetical protein
MKSNNLKRCNFYDILQGFCKAFARLCNALQCSRNAFEIFLQSLAMVGNVLQCFCNILWHFWETLDLSVFFYKLQLMANGDFGPHGQLAILNVELVNSTELGSAMELCLEEWSAKRNQE